MRVIKTVSSQKQEKIIKQGVDALVNLNEQIEIVERDGVSQEQYIYETVVVENYASFDDVVKVAEVEMVREKIAVLERNQARALREVTLDPNNTYARQKLADIDAEIAQLRTPL